MNLNTGSYSIRSIGAQQTQKVSDIQLVQSNLKNIAAKNVNKALIYISDCNLPVS